MITEFLHSWPLFGPAYLTALTGAILLSVVGVFVVARDQLFLAAAVGMRTAWWTLVVAVILGLSAGLMLRSTGLLFTFGCLVLPALAAKRLSRNTAALF